MTQAVVAIFLVLERNHKGAKVTPWGAGMCDGGAGLQLPTGPIHDCTSIGCLDWRCLDTTWLDFCFLLWPGPHLTAASIATRIAVTFLEFQLTVHTRVTWAACAGVTPLATVGACCPVLTRGMVGTVVEICRDRNQPAEQTQRYLHLQAPYRASSSPCLAQRGFNLVFQVQLSILPCQ